MEYMAFNLATGEVIICETRRQLNDATKLTSYLDYIHFGIRAKWIFSRKKIMAM